MDSGLAGVVVAETVLSRSDGEQGILWVRGYTLPHLVADFGYEGTVALLWEGLIAGSVAYRSYYLLRDRGIGLDHA